MNNIKQIITNKHYNLLHEIQNNNITAIKNILAYGIDINLILTPNFRTDELISPLHLAIKNTSCKNIIQLLLKYGANVNIQDTKGQTPLHYAISYNQAYIAERLIQTGADVNIQDTKGQTPLHYAARYNQTHIAKILLENGACIDARDNIGHTPLHLCTIAACSNRSANGAVHNYYKTIDALLHYGANSNVTLYYNEYTPFTIGLYGNLIKAFTLFYHYSDYLLANADKSKLSILYEGAIADLSLGIEKVEFLLDMQIPINNIKPNDILMSAFKYKRPEIAKLLLLNGANINRTIPPNLDSYLHLASKDGCDELVSICLLEGIDTNNTNTLGATALHYAASKGYKEIVKTLLNNEANVNIKTKTTHSNDNDIEKIPIASTALDVAQYNNKTEVVKLINNYISTPKSLCQLSRITIRKCIKSNQKNINIKQAIYDDAIHLPLSMKNYVYNIII
jgi:ankyrin repeat protein